MNSKKIKDNIEVLNECLMATSLLSNNTNTEWKDDAITLINFICESYEVNDIKDDIITIITEEISNLATINEYTGLKSYRSYDDDNKDVEIFYDLKGRTLLQIHRIGEALHSHDFPIVGEFNYDTVANYIPNDRFNTILKGSGYGNVQLTAMVGLMYVCGIGTEMDYEFGLIRLKQAALWGCLPALKYIANLYKLQNDQRNYKHYLEVYDACFNYYYDGITSIPEKHRKKYSKDAVNTFTLMTAMFQHIIACGHGVINHLFLEVILAEKIPFNTKLDAIKSFNDDSWKDLISNSIHTIDLLHLSK